MKKLDIQTAVQLLKQYLAEVEHLRTLDYGNQEFALWRYKVRDVLEASFTKDSDEYQRFATAHYGVAIGAGQESYLRLVDNHETALKSVINKYEFERPIKRSKYEFTSPVYWAERFWHWKPVATFVGWIKTVVGWVKTHRLVSAIITFVMFVAAILAIWGFVLNWGR